VVSIFLLSFFFSSPILSGRRLDVYHTSTHGVAFVQIQNAGLKCAARGSLEMQDAKMTQKSPSAHHRTTLSGCIFANKACIDNRKKFVKQQYVPHMSAKLCGVVQGMELRNFRRGRLSSWVSAHVLDIFAVFSSGT